MRLSGGAIGHKLAEIVPTGGEWSALCECGWSSRTERHRDIARNRWWSHKHELPGADPDIDAALDALDQAGIAYEDVT